MSWLLAALKAIPGVTKLIDVFLRIWKEYDQKRKEVIADERKVEKDARNDAAIAAAVQPGLPKPEDASGQQQTPDRAP